MFRGRYPATIRSVFGILLFSLSVWFLHEELGPYRIRDILHALWQIPWRQFSLALAITVLSYLVLTANGILDLRSMERSVSYRKTVANSFIASALNNNVGYSAILGLSLRNRLYSLLEFSKVSLQQTAISFLDWILAGSALYFLLPGSASLPYATFLWIFLAARLAGLLSRVPGGLGVFEAVLLMFFPPEFSTPSVFASLLVFRGIYYLLPLAVATTLLAGEEILRRK